MSEILTTSQKAREALAKGLNALQSDPAVPPALVELAAPIAQAMGALHQIERSGGTVVQPHAETALGHVRTALGALQAQAGGSPHPAVMAAMEAVASSLGAINGLGKMTPAAAQPAPQAAPVQPAPQAAPVQPAPQAAPAAPRPAPSAPQIGGPPRPGAPAAPRPVGSNTVGMVVPAPVQPAPQPVQPAPVHVAPAPVHVAPAPVHVAPAPVQPAPQPVQPAPVHVAPAPVQPAPKPVQPAPVHVAPAPVQPAPKPVVPIAPPSQGGSFPAMGSDPVLPTSAPAAPAARAADPFAMTAASSDPFATPAGAPRAAGPMPTINADLGAHSATNFYKGLAGNDIIDHGGLFVATYLVPRIGSTVRLRVSLPGSYEFDAEAVVKWARDSGSSETPGFGAKFTHIAAEARQLVYRYVRNREPIFYDDL